MASYGQQHLLPAQQSPPDVHIRAIDLARGLQQGLPELVGKLEDSGYRADGWKPAGTVAATAPAPDSQGASNHFTQSDAQSHSGWSQQQEGRQNQHQSNQPRWVQELESSMNGGES